MRVLITGGFGYLGGRIACYFAEQGYEVVISSRKQQEPPAWCPTAKVVQINWDNPALLREVCAGIDLVIHTAGMNAQDCESNPSEALFFNGLATANLVEAAVNKNVPRFIFLSTSHVYNSPLTGIISEETCTQNLHPYATSNRAGENSVLWAHAKGRIQGIVLRLSNIIGAPAHKEVNVWNLLTNDLCRQAVMNQKMVLHSSGKQYRNFLGMKSLLNVISDISRHNFINSDNTVFNISNKNSLLVIAMADLIKKRCDLILDRETFIQTPNLPEHSTAPVTLVISNQKIMDIGIPVKHELEEDIDSIIHFCKKYFRDHV